MSTPMSAAQSAQQNNRSSDGKYGFGTHAEPDRVNLQTEPENPILKIHEQLVDSGMEPARARIYVCAQLLTQTAQSHFKASHQAQIEGREELAAVYHLAYMPLLEGAKAMADDMENPDIAEQEIGSARRRLHSTFSMFSSFGPNPAVTVSRDLDKLLAHAQDYLEKTKPECSEA